MSHPEPESPAAPLAGLRFSLVGAGRVGTSLAAWAVARGASAVTVAGRTRSRGEGTAARLGARWCDLERLSTAGEDLLLLAVADPALPELARRLARRLQARVALHTAGCLDAAVLRPLADAGVAVGSLHPLKAFPRPLPDLADARGTTFAVDGDVPARALATRLVAAWGGEPFELAGDLRILYHLAATVAAGGVVTLISAVEELAARTGLPRRVTSGYLALARGALDQVDELGDPVAAITGPVARGDRDTEARHRAALARAAPELAPLVEALNRETRRQRARRRGGAGEPEGG